MLETDTRLLNMNSNFALKFTLLISFNPTIKITFSTPNLHINVVIEREGGDERKLTQSHWVIKSHNIPIYLDPY